MREIVLAFVAMAAISLSASYALPEFGFSSQDRTSGPAVRLD
ncbi:MAG: hypothetical protein AAGF27_05985 [Pseudomonadota bacterium]